MMKDVLVVIKKELYRFFSDKRLFLTVILLPGLMIYLMYSLMGSAITNLTDEEDVEYIIVSENAPESFSTYLSNLEINYSLKNYSGNLEVEKNDLLNENIHLIVIFDETFMSDAIALRSPNVDVYYNPSNNSSSSIYQVTNSYLSSLKELIISQELGIDEVFTINKDNNSFEVYDDKQMTGMIFSMLLPFLIVTFLFSGAMSVAPESIAGEKERGTIATLLVTPVKRSNIALGKIFALSTISVLSALSSFIGIILSLPKLMGSTENVDATIYGIGDYALILFILISTVLIIVAMISVVSAFAKNLKESNMLILPLYFVSMGIGLLSMFSQSAQTNPLLYLIPIYNSMQSLISVFSFDVSIVNLLITILSNIGYTVLFIVILSKMFNNEKIMFAK